MSKRIVFTGGSGRVGRHVIPLLMERGHKVLNLDLTPLDHPGVTTVVTDLADAGEVYSALTMHFGFPEYFGGEGRGPVDAIVHFGAIPRIFMLPDNAMFRANVMGAYNICEAATKFGISKVIVASSECAYGICFAEGVRDFTAFPVEEDTDTDPTDSYGLSKLLAENIARSFASRSGNDFYALRIGGVIEPHEYETRFPGFLTDPITRRRDAWTYIDVRDLAQIVHRCIETDGLGYQVFNAVNDQIISRIPTAEFLAQHLPDVPITRELETFEGPISNRKARDLLGFIEEHNWRRYVLAD